MSTTSVEGSASRLSGNRQPTRDNPQIALDFQVHSIRAPSCKSSACDRQSSLRQAVSFFQFDDPLLHRQAAPVVIIIFNVESWQNVASLRRVHCPKFFYQGLCIRIWITTKICAV